MDTNTREEIDQLYKRFAGKALASLIRILGDFDRAEEALQEAFVQALESWPQEGLPDNPGAWLISAGRFRAIDKLRRRARFDGVLTQLADELEQTQISEPSPELIADDALRLIFTCCHPSLAQEAQIALTLREVCGLTTEAVAKAFLIPPPTLAQRIVRAKNKIRDAGIPYEVPEEKQLPERLQQVLQVIYLVFNEGYSSSGGDALIRQELCDEAMRLARLLLQLLTPRQQHKTSAPLLAEIHGLLALMLLQDSRRQARSDPAGDIVLLEDQDRSRWDQQQIAEGLALVDQALSGHPAGRYALQAAIAAVHAEASEYAATDWRQIAGLYVALYQLQPTPIVALNHAVAVGMYRGANAGLDLLDELLARQQLDSFHLIHAARADFLRRLGRSTEAIHAYQQALALTDQQPEQRFLQKRLAEMN